MTNARFDGRLLAGAAALALTLVAPALHAQTDVDSRWLPWVGCWEIVGDGRTEESQVICVEPREGDPAAVELLSAVEGAESEVLWSDGRERTISQAGCEGTQRSYFSPDGHRLYVNGTYVCDDGAVQEGRGVLAMVSDDEWVDIRSLTQDDQTVVMAQRYVQATPSAIRAAGRVELTSPRTTLARRLAAAAPDVKTLREVHTEVGAQATMAWLMETGQSLDLDADALVTLADAGVETDVIDMAIAVSYPDDFYLRPGQGTQVAQMEKIAPRQGNNTMWYSPFARRVALNYGFWGPAYSPWGYLNNPMGFMYGSFSPWGIFGFGRGSAWGWNGFGYPMGPGWGNNWFGNGPLIIRRGGQTVTDTRGRAVAGRGYRSGGRTGAPVAGRTPTQRMNPPRSSRPRSGTARPATSRGSASGDRGSASTGRRTAKPRRSGGGGGGV